MVNFLLIIFGLINVCVVLAVAAVLFDVAYIWYERILSEKRSC